MRLALFAGLAHFCIEVAGNFLPILYPLWQDTLSLSFTQIGAVALVANLATTAPQPLFGWWAGRAQAAPLVLIGVLVSGVFFGLSGLSPDYPLLLATVALGGLGSALFHPSAAAVAGSAHVGARKRGMRMSIFSVGGNAGAALSPVVVGVAVGAFALAGTLTVGLWVVVATPLLWWFSRRSTTGRDTGTTTAGRSTRSASDTQAEGDTGTAAANRSPIRPGATAGLGALAAVILLAGSRSWFQVSLISYLPLWITENGGSTQLAGTMLFALLASVSVGSLLGGALSDRFGTWVVLVTAVLLLLPLHAALLSFGAPQGALAEYATTAAIGCCMGATFPVAIVAAQQAWPSNIGMAAGLVIGFGFLPGGIGATVVGVVADRDGLAAALGILYWPVAVGAACALTYLAVARIRSLWANSNGGVGA